MKNLRKITSKPKDNITTLLFETGQEKFHLKNLKFLGMNTLSFTIKLKTPACSENAVYLVGG